MPRTEIDYSNTIIYKITCKDPNVKDVYVGHTTNFVQRKYAHKQCCVNKKSSNYTCKLYNTIRSIGGWNNWTMEIINYFNCRDHYEARIKEQEYFILLNANLNSIEPLPKPKPKEVVPTNIVVESNKPKTVIFCKTDATNKTPSFHCEKCNFTCIFKSNYDIHLSTRKHINRANAKKNEDDTIYECPCGSTYKHSSSYYRHKKTCTYVPTPPPEPKTPDPVEHTSKNQDLYAIIHLLIKENQEIRNLFIDQNKILTELVKNQYTTNSHNQ